MSAADESPVASAHPAMSGPDAPASAATRAASTPGTASESPIADHSLPLRSRALEIGASINQNPSGADAMTGPNNLAAASTTAADAPRTTQGTRERPIRQAAVSQRAMVVCDWRTRLITIAPRTTIEKMAK